MSDAPKKYHREVKKAMANKDELLLDYVWELWQRIEDVKDPSPSLVEACVYLICQYDFDVDCLPGILFELVCDELRQIDKEDAGWDL